MSYCRWGDESDVYVYNNISGGWTCCACLFGGKDNFKTRKLMIAHLERHKKAGHKVPQYAIERLKEEINDRLKGGGE